ncbi:hypothetical protein ACWKSP_15755 [Micromonosporaceae bacterium Da 78-11]
MSAALFGAVPGLLNLQSIVVRQAINSPEVLGRANAVIKTISHTTTIGASPVVWPPLQPAHALSPVAGSRAATVTGHVLSSWPAHVL